MTVTLALRCDGCGTLALRGDADGWEEWEETHEDPLGDERPYLHHHCPDCQEDDD